MRRTVVSVLELKDFFDTGDIADLAISAFEERYYLFFEMLSYTDDRDYIIKQINNVWKQANKLASSPDIKLKNSALFDKVQKILNQVYVLQVNLELSTNVFRRFKIKWRLYWLEQKEVLLVDVLCYAIVNHPDKTEEAKKFIIEYIEDRFNN